MRALAVLVLLPACLYRDAPGDGQLKCNSTVAPECPSGFHCSPVGTCWRDGHDPDLAGVVLPDLTVVGGGPTDLAGVDLAGADLAGAPDAAVPVDLAGADLVCIGLQCQQVSCATGSTTVTGTVTTPSGALPLYDVTVFVPNSTPQAFVPGPSIAACGTPSGDPVVLTHTDVSGHFQLDNVPVGSAIPLVIQIGKWRRQVLIPTVTACTETMMPPDQTRLPRTQAEGDLPQIALVTGNADALECLLRRIGVDDGEFTDSNSAGRVHLWAGNGATPAAGTAQPEANLWNDINQLNRYDLIIDSCHGSTNPVPTPTQISHFNTYIDGGGRALVVHYGYGWLNTNPQFGSLTAWNPMQTNPPQSVSATLGTGFPKGETLAEWLQGLPLPSPSPSPGPVFGQVVINQSRHDFDSVASPALQWVAIAGAPNIPLQFSFDAPVGVSPQVGRVVFSDFHVVASSATTMPFPSECPNTPISPQEEELVFMLFQLAECVNTN